MLYSDKEKNVYENISLKELIHIKNQKVLMTSKETSSEEIQSFFHRAILCNYNTLFVVEINDSFTDFQ